MAGEATAGLRWCWTHTGGVPGIAAWFFFGFSPTENLSDAVSKPPPSFLTPHPRGSPTQSITATSRGGFAEAPLSLGCPFPRLQHLGLSGKRLSGFRGPQAAPCPARRGAAGRGAERGAARRGRAFLPSHFPMRQGRGRRGEKRFFFFFKPTTLTPTRRQMVDTARGCGGDSEGMRQPRFFLLHHLP